MIDLLQCIEGEIQNRRLLKRGNKILVAVSGGMDSMVLLLALKKLSTKHKWKITIAHFNHQLRGRASDADEKLVRKTGAALKLPVAIGSEDVRRFADVAKLSIEMAARRLRHRFFVRVAKERGIRTVALAHHANDRVELFFLRLLRGAGGEGLSGMKWSSPSPLDQSVVLIRPLLDLTKDELERFARENKICYREDATNASLDIPRNRIRNELLPLLKKNYQPGLTETVLRLMEIIGAESDFVGEAAWRWIAKRKSCGWNSFSNLPVAPQRRVLQLRLAELGFAANFKLVEQLRLKPGIRVSVWPGLTVSRTDVGTLLLEREQEADFNMGELSVDLSSRAGGVVFAGRKFIWQIQSQKKFRSPQTKALDATPELRELFDADKIGGKILLRHWCPGDRFQPIGLKAAVKLQDLFTNAKIPRERRRNLVVAQATGGEIFWIEGLRIGENFKLTPGTKRRLCWTWRSNRR